MSKPQPCTGQLHGVFPMGVLAQQTPDDFIDAPCLPVVRGLAQSQRIGEGLAGAVAHDRAS
jgi:hypothetical protein